MAAQDDVPRAGCHRMKRRVDRLWLNYMLKQGGFTVNSFGAALARETKRGRPFDKASASRRLAGKIPFTAQECEALSRIFGVPLEEILQRVGSAPDAPTVAGRVDTLGAVTTDLAIPARDKSFKLTLDAQDGWAGAVLTVSTATTQPIDAPRGVYVMEVKDATKLQQLIGVHGKQAILAAPFDTSSPVQTVPAATITAMRRVTKITL